MSAVLATEQVGQNVGLLEVVFTFVITTPSHEWRVFSAAVSVLRLVLADRAGEPTS